MSWEEPKPGFRWPISVGKSISATANEVWDVISMPGNLELCHPYCQENPVAVWSGKDSIDEIHYLSGWIFERRFCRWREGVGYDLEIGRHGGQTSFVSWRISSLGAQTSSLNITIYPHVLQTYPSAVRWLPYIIRIKPMLKQYLSSVVGGFEWYITRGEAVPRNQFGSHPWFSTSN